MQCLVLVSITYDNSVYKIPRQNIFDVSHVRITEKWNFVRRRELSAVWAVGLWNCVYSVSMGIDIYPGQTFNVIMISVDYVWNLPCGQHYCDMRSIAMTCRETSLAHQKARFSSVTSNICAIYKSMLPHIRMRCLCECDRVFGGEYGIIFVSQSA